MENYLIFISNEKSDILDILEFKHLFSKIFVFSKIKIFGVEIFEFDEEYIKIIKENIKNILCNILILNFLNIEEMKKQYLKHNLLNLNNIEYLKNYYLIGLNFKIDIDGNYSFLNDSFWTTSKYIKSGPFERNFYYKSDYRYYLSLDNCNDKIIKNGLFEVNKYSNVQKNSLDRNIYGVYFISCFGNYLNIVKEQIFKLISTNLYNNTKKLICFICNVQENVLEFLKSYSKIQIISTKENLYEKYAINQYKDYIDDSKYNLYYIHTKGVTRKAKNYLDWRYLCEYFTINKWQLCYYLLNYYDSVGINLSVFPSLHYSGNFWWSKSENLNQLKNIDDKYLSPEMYVCSNLNYRCACLFKSFIIHWLFEYDKTNYINISDIDLLKQITSIPIFNFLDKNTLLFEHPILKLEGIFEEFKKINSNKLIIQKIEEKIELLEKKYGLISYNTIDKEINILSHLKDISKNLIKSGYYIILCSDKNYNSNYYIKESSIEEIIKEKDINFANKKILENNMLKTHNNTIEHWKNNHGVSFNFNNIENNIWNFSYLSFLNLIEYFIKENLIDFIIEESYKTCINEQEFIVILRKI